jgi:TonB family protein
MKIMMLAVLGIALLVGVGQAFCQVTHMEAPLYPDLARQARIEGTVKFKAHLNPGGNVNQLEGLEGHNLLKEEAERNLRKWTFAPTKAESVEIWYEFRLLKPDVSYVPESRVAINLPANLGSEPVKVLIVSQGPVPIRDGVTLRPRH